MAEEQQQVSKISMQSQQQADLTRWQLLTDDILMAIEHDLRGDTVDNKTGEWVTAKDGYKPSINEYGIRELMKIVKSKINKNTFLSNLDEDDVFNITQQTHLNLIQLVFVKQVEFAIPTEHLEQLVDMVIHMVYIGLKRAQFEGERKFLERAGRQEKTIHTFSSQPEENKGALATLSRALRLR